MRRQREPSAIANTRAGQANYRSWFEAKLEAIDVAWPLAKVAGYDRSWLQRGTAKNGGRSLRRRPSALRLVPRPRDERLAIPPSLNDRIREPFILEVRMIEGDDLQSPLSCPTMRCTSL